MLIKGAPAVREVILLRMLLWPPQVNLWRLQRWWSLVTLGCTQPPKGIWPLAYNEGSRQLYNSNFTDNWPNFFIESSHPQNFSFRKLLFGLLAEGTMALFLLWQDITIDFLRPKTNKALYEVTRHDEISHWANIPENTAAGQPGWYTEVAETEIATANYVSTIRGASTSCEPS